MNTSLFWLMAIAIQLYKLYRFRKLIKLYKYLYRTVKQLPLLSVSELCQKFSQKALSLGKYVLCQGRITGSQSFRSRLDPKLNVIYSQLIMERIMQIGNRTSEVKRLLEKIRPSFLKIGDAQNTINIYETGFTKMITSKIRRKVTKLQEKLFKFNWLLSIFSKLPLPTKFISIIYTQTSIPDNSPNVVFAKIGTSSTSQICFEKPLAVGPFKQSILEEYANSISFYTVSSYLMGFIFLLTCFFFYKYEIKSIIEKLKKKELTLSTFDSYKQIKVADRTCAKCHEKISNLINHPCGHLNLCDECGSRSEKCQECKKRPKEQFQVYPS